MAEIVSEEAATPGRRALVLLACGSIVFQALAFVAPGVTVASSLRVLAIALLLSAFVIGVKTAQAARGFTAVLLAAVAALTAIALAFAQMQ